VTTFRTPEEAKCYLAEIVNDERRVSPQSIVAPRNLSVVDTNDWYARQKKLDLEEKKKKKEAENFLRSYKLHYCAADSPSKSSKNFTSIEGSSRKMVGVDGYSADVTISRSSSANKLLIVEGAVTRDLERYKQTEKPKSINTMLSDPNESEGTVVLVDKPAKLACDDNSVVLRKLNVTERNESTKSSSTTGGTLKQEYNYCNNLANINMEIVERDTVQMEQELDICKMDESIKPPHFHDIGDHDDHITTQSNALPNLNYNNNSFSSEKISGSNEKGGRELLTESYQEDSLLSISKSVSKDFNSSRERFEDIITDIDNITFSRNEVSNDTYNYDGVDSRLDLQEGVKEAALVEAQMEESWEKVQSEPLSIVSGVSNDKSNCIIFDDNDSSTLEMQEALKEGGLGETQKDDAWEEVQHKAPTKMQILMKEQNYKQKKEGIDPISMWHSEWKLTLRQRKEAENDANEEQIEQAQADLAAFQAVRDSRCEAKAAKNRINEREKLDALKMNLENDKFWQNVVKMVDLSHDSADGSEDCARMRDVLIFLKSNTDHTSF